MGNKHTATMHKNKSLADYIHAIPTLKCEVCLMSVKTGRFIKLYNKIMQNQ